MSQHAAGTVPNPSEPLYDKWTAPAARLLNGSPYIRRVEVKTSKCRPRVVHTRCGIRRPIEFWLGLNPAQQPFHGCAWRPHGANCAALNPTCHWLFFRFCRSRLFVAGTSPWRLAERGTNSRGAFPESPVRLLRDHLAVRLMLVVQANATAPYILKRHVNEKSPILARNLLVPDTISVRASEA